MPNAIYPPRWQSVPPPRHPMVWRWLEAFVLLVLLLLFLAMLMPTS